MKVSLADKCDLFPYASTLPVNLVVETDGEDVLRCVDALRIRRQAGGQSVEDVYRYIPGLNQSMVLPIPYIKGECDSSLIVTTESKGEPVSNLEYELKGFRGDTIILGNEMTADSIFVRSLPGSPLLAMGDFFRDIGGPVRGSADGAPIPPQRAVEILGIFQKYFDSFNVTDQKISDGFAEVTAVEEAMMYKTGSSYTLGILFMGLAYRLGLNPLVFMSEGRCFIGLETSMELGNLKDAASVHVQRISTSISYPRIRSFIHRCVVIEINGDKDISKNIEDSYDCCSSEMIWDGVSCYSDELEKIEMIESMRGNIEKENSNGERFCQEDGGPGHRRAADSVGRMHHKWKLQPRR